MSIRTRLLGSILGVLITGLAAMSFWTNQLTEQTLTSSILAQQSAIAEGESGRLSSLFSFYQYALEQVADSAYLKDLLRAPKDATALVNATRRITSSKEYFPECVVFGLIDSTGLVVASSNTEVVNKQNLADREYFIEAMKGKFAISQASLSRNTGKPSFFIAAPVRIGTNISGVAYMTIDLEKMSKTHLEKLKIGKRGYAFLSEPPGRTLAHPDPQRIFEDTSSFDWLQAMLQRKNGTLEYTFGGKERVGGFATVPQTGWLIVLAAEKDDVLSEVAHIRNASIIAAICTLLVVALVVILVVRGITGTLQRTVLFAQAVASGDLEHELHFARKDELGTLGRALQTMLEQLRTMIVKSDRETKEAEAATRIATEAVKEAEKARAEADRAKIQGQLEAADNLESVVVRMASAAEQLSAQIEQASRGADVQRERASETATAMEEMNASVLEVARNATEAAQASDKTKSEASDGAKLVQSVTTAIVAVQKDSQRMGVTLNALGEQAEDIGQIMSVISDIADQTNLLALNAAIEAARAGDAGRGFAVVADEVRKLAEKTMIATKQVGEAVRAIQAGTQESIQVMEEASQNIVNSTDLSEKAGVALKHILLLMESSTEQVRAIAVASGQQSTASEQINHGTEDINRIASETASSMRQSSQAIGDLSHMAQQLNALIEGLKKG